MSPGQQGLDSGRKAISGKASQNQAPLNNAPLSLLRRLKLLVSWQRKARRGGDQPGVWFLISRAEILSNLPSTWADC